MSFAIISFNGAALSNATFQRRIARLESGGNQTRSHSSAGDPGTRLPPQSETPYSAPYLPLQVAQEVRVREPAAPSPCGSAPRRAAGSPGGARGRAASRAGAAARPGGCARSGPAAPARPRGRATPRRGSPASTWGSSPNSPQAQWMSCSTPCVSSGGVTPEVALHPLVPRGRAGPPAAARRGSAAAPARSAGRCAGCTSPRPPRCG